MAIKNNIIRKFNMLFPSLFEDHDKRLITDEFNSQFDKELNARRKEKDSFKATILNKESIITEFNYPVTKDPEDFLNKLAGKRVTIIEEGIEDNEIIYVCKEFPEYAIPSYYLRSMSSQAVNVLEKKTMLKIEQIIEEYGLKEELSQYI